MRIMHLVCSDRFAGVEQFVLRLALAQAADGHDVHVAGGAANRMRDPLRAAGASWDPVVGLRDALRAAHSRRSEVQVVNSHMTDADVAAALALGRHGPALVSTRHFSRRRGRTLGVPVDTFLSRRVDAEISISSAVADATGVPSTVVRTGVPHVDVTARPGAVVLMAQRLQPEKRTDLGIRAFVASGLAAQDWRLDIAGDGVLRGHLQRLIDDLGATSSVRLLGFRDDLPDLLSGASLFLAPCDVEGLGLAVLEAMATGVAPIASASAGHLDVLAGLDERSGFHPGDVQDAAGALRVLASDPTRRSQLAEAARRRVATEFSVRQQVDGTERVYLRAIERAGRRGWRA